MVNEVDTELEDLKRLNICLELRIFGMTEQRDRWRSRARVTEEDLDKLQEAWDSLIARAGNQHM